MIAWLLACAADPRLPDPAAALLADLDADRSGRVEPAEAAWLAKDAGWAAADADHDGALDGSELSTWAATSAIEDLATGRTHVPGAGKGGPPPRGPGRPPGARPGAPPGAPPPPRQGTPPDRSAAEELERVR